MFDQFTADGRISLDRALAYWVSRVYLAARAELYRRFRRHDVELTPEQWMVLVRLWEEEGLSQTDLAERTFRDLPTMSRILAVMEKGGLVQRRKDPADQRARLVFLSTRAQALRETLVPEARRMVETMLAGISAADVEITRRTLARIVANLEHGEGPRA